MDHRQWITVDLNAHLWWAFARGGRDSNSTEQVLIELRILTTGFPDTLLGDNSSAHDGLTNGRESLNTIRILPILHGKSNLSRARFFKLSGLTVLLNVFPREALSVHRDVDAVRESLHERQRTAEVKESVGAPELVRNHRAGQDDRLSAQFLSQDTGGHLHRVGPVGDDDTVFRRPDALFDDGLPVGGGHLQAVNHHEGAHGKVELAPGQREHFGEVRVLEEQLSVELVVFLVERTAGDKNAYGHGKILRSVGDGTIGR